MRYAESESAFDTYYARSQGLPLEVQESDKLLETVEEFRDDLNAFLKQVEKSEIPGLYILDSLDALSDAAELERFRARKPGDEEKGTFGAQKAKEMSELFRLLVKDIGRSNCSLGIISQIRDRIGVTFGEQHSRSGGKALDFYASTIIFLHELGKETRTSLGETRATGIYVRAKCKKLKVGKPFRECDFRITFEYGIENELSNLEFLKGDLEKETYSDYKKRLETARKEQDFVAIDQINSELEQDVISKWKKVDANLAPKIKKYFRP
jgi:RecA/RadA recombinase